MNPLIYPISILFIGLAVSLVSWIMTLGKEKEQRVCYKAGTIIVCAVLALILIIASALVAVFCSPFWAAIPIAIAGAGMTLLTAHLAFFSIEYDEESFTLRRLFRKKRTYTYDRITSVKGQYRDVTLYVEKRSITLDAVASGKDAFVALVKAWYKVHHGGLSIPVGKKKDLFDNNLESPLEFIIVFALMGILIAASLTLGSFFLYDGLFGKDTATDFTVSSYGVENSDLKMEDQEKDDALIIKKFRKRVEDPDAFLARCGAHETFRKTERKNTLGNGSQLVLLIADDGTVILDEQNKAVRDCIIVFLMMTVLALLLIAVIVLMIVMARHPGRFKKKTLNLFFKDGYIIDPDKK